ncbi:MAG: MEDS domain-containing protein, partial [Thermoanaerobaculia bacterium]
MDQPLRILLADDHEAVRRGLRSILEPQWEVCGEATNGREAVEEARATRPDVVLLDMKMPELNGLEAARVILDQRPGTRVLILTASPSEELRVAARNAGVEAVLAQSDSDTLASLLDDMQEQTVHLAGAAVTAQRHIAGFFTSEAERYRVLGPFTAEGLARGEKAFHIVNADEHAMHVQRLADAGAAVHDPVRQRGFELAPWETFYYPSGDFNQYHTVERLHGVLADADRAGFRRTRLVACMEWALVERSGVNELAQYESRINFTFDDELDVVVCAYD